MTQAWPKGKMIEGRSGGSGRGTRRELWAPPDSGSAQPADHTLYRVPTLDPRRPLISFPPPLPHPRTCLLVTGKNSAAPERTFSSLVSAEWRAQRENDRREERGIWAGHSKRIEGPTWQRFFNQRIARCIVYRRPTLAAHSFPSLRRFLTRRTCLLAPGEKFCRTQAHVQLGTRLRRMAGPKGK